MQLRLPSRPLLYRRTLILLVHVALIPLAYLTAFGLRFDFRIPPDEFVHFQATVWWLLGIRLVVFQALVCTAATGSTSGCATWSTWGSPCRSPRRCSPWPCRRSACR